MATDAQQHRAERLDPDPLRVSVILPTYEERSNIARLISEVARCVPHLHEIIVVDDDSPDETWRVAEELGSEVPMLRVIRRVNDRGLTTAIRDGVRAATGNVAVWMDCDLSMRPAETPKLIEAIEGGADVAVGSRYTPGGVDARDVRFHKFLSWVICKFAWWVLKDPVRDSTSGFIAIRKAAVDGFSWEGDYGEYFIALMQHTRRAGFRVTEVPYTLYPRESGESKTASNPLDFFVKGRKYVQTILRLRFSS